MSHFHSRHDPGAQTKGEVIHWAPLYHFAFGPFIRRTHDAVVGLAGPRGGERVLDVGCGPGSLTMALKARTGPAGTAHGIDASPEMIEVARRSASRARVDVTFQVGLAEALPFPGGTFDLVVSQLAIHHLPDALRPSAFAEMHRVLKSDGRCLIVDFEPPKSGPGRFVARLLLAPMMMQVDVRAYRALLEAAGFNEIESGPTRHRLLSFVRGRKNERAPGHS